MQVIGMIGGIGSGKSAATKCLHKHGAGYLELDKITHEVLDYPEVIQQVKMVVEPHKIKLSDSFFIINSLIDEHGKLNRRAVAAVAFSVPEVLHAIEQITLPLVTDQIKLRLSRFHSDYVPVIVLDAPLLLEAKWNKFCDKIVFVDVPSMIRMERAKDRTTGAKLSPEQWRKREERQISIEHKRGIADYIIDNSKDIAFLEKQVEELWEKIR